MTTELNFFSENKIFVENIRGIYVSGSSLALLCAVAQQSYFYMYAVGVHRSSTANVVKFINGNLSNKDGVYVTFYKWQKQKTCRKAQAHLKRTELPYVKRAPRSWEALLLKALMTNYNMYKAKFSSKSEPV